MPVSVKIPTGHVSVHDQNYDNYLSVEPKTGRLFWAGKEIVARKTIDFSGIKLWWAAIAALVAVLAGLGAVITGLVDLNKEICWVKVGSCVAEKKSPDPPKPPPPDPPRPVVLSGVYFDTASTVLRIESSTTLENLLQSLKDDPALRVEIQGHTDDTGTADHNVDLSDKRAASVAQWLIGRGIADDRLTSKGYGATRPIADNRTVEGRAKNRRVQFLRL